LSSSAPSENGAFTVAVLGRPNVGKSTLFNRLLGRQRAITDPTPGVTRDVLEGELDLGGPRVRLLDTGGYTLERGQLEREVARRSLAIAASSDLTLALVEAGGLTREDQALFDRLRRLPDFPDRVVLVINKVDGPKQEQALGEFQGLGFGSQAAVSAAHGRGIGELKKLIQQRLQAAGCARLQQASLPGSAAGLRAEAAVPEQEADLAAQAAAGGEGGPASWAGAEVRLAIIGKPNTGKSTLLNRLLGQERALVTESPGTTRDPVGGTLRYRGRSLRVLDTAGIRRRSRVSEAVEYYSVQRAIRSIEEADLVVLLMDVREGVSEQDKKIAALAAGAGRGVILALNKVDLLEEGQGRQGGRRKAGLRAIEQKVRFDFPLLDFAPLVTLSAATGSGVARLLAEVLEVARQLHRRVSTGRLNLAVKRWVAEYALPVRGKNVKIRYATQTGANPVRFVFFVNSLRLFPALYTKYLKNRIREDLGFGKVPVDIRLRES
jgi:GTP-binding protein